MLVQCPGCRTTYRVRDTLITTSTPTFRCSLCKHIFVLGKPDPLEKPEVVDDLAIKGEREFLPGDDFNYLISPFRVRHPSPFTESRWIGFLKGLSYILPKRCREEWIGDLFESRVELLQNGYRKIWVNLITTSKMLLLLTVLLKIKLSDFLSPGKNETPRGE